MEFKKIGYDIYLLDFQNNIYYNPHYGINRLKRSVSPYWLMKCLKISYSSNTITSLIEFRKGFKEDVEYLTNNLNSQKMKNTAEKAVTAGAQSSQKAWIDCSSKYSEERLANLNAKQNIEIEGIKIPYSRAYVVKDEANKKTKTFNQDDYVFPLLSRKVLNQAMKSLPVEKWRRLVYLSYSVSLYSELETQGLDDGGRGGYYTTARFDEYLKIKNKGVALRKAKKENKKIKPVKGAYSKIKKVGKKIKSEAKRLALSTKKLRLPETTAPKASNSTILSAFKPVLKETRKRILLDEHKAAKLSKKVMYGRSTRAHRIEIAKNAMEEAKELARLERRRISMSEQSIILKHMPKREVVILPPKQRVDTAKYLKGGKDKKAFIKTKHKDKSSNRNNLHAYYKAETPYCPNRNKKSRNYTATIQRDKKSMNYVKPVAHIQAKKLKVNKESLVCITNGNKVYRVSRERAEQALHQLKNFTYTSKTKWKQARLEGNAELTIQLSTTPPISNIKKAGKRTQIKRERLAKYREDYIKSEDFKNRVTNKVELDNKRKAS
jgi:hypothetical protein